jgi:hybrid cluster-associated redox disulfide protein
MQRAFLFSVICASAKRDFSQSSIFGAMDEPMIHIHLTVDEVLQNWPRAFSVFMKNRTKCVGCFMQQFCTLRDVAETYEISPEKLISDIEDVSNEENTQRSIL